jgi:hypothetical protein
LQVVKLVSLRQAAPRLVAQPIQPMTRRLEVADIPVGTRAGGKTGVARVWFTRRCHPDHSFRMSDVEANQRLVFE